MLDFFAGKHTAGELIIIDKVALECMRIAKGVVVEQFPFVTIKRLQVKSDTLIPSNKFYNMLESNFCRPIYRKKLEPEEYESRKASFLASADCGILLYADQISRENRDDVIVVTEETRNENDDKLYRKIPVICDFLDIKVTTIPGLLKEYYSEVAPIFKSE